MDTLNASLHDMPDLWERQNRRRGWFKIKKKSRVCFEKMMLQRKQGQI